MTGRRQWHPTPVLLPGKSHGQRSPVGCSPWGSKESNRTEWLTLCRNFSWGMWNLVPWSGIKPRLPAKGAQIVVTGLPGKSHHNLTCPKLYSWFSTLQSYFSSNFSISTNGSSFFQMLKAKTCRYPWLLSYFLTTSKSSENPVTVLNICRIWALLIGFTSHTLIQGKMTYHLV